MAHGHPDYQAISTPTLPDLGEGQEMWFQSEIKLVGANGTEDLISYVVPDDMELRICSGIVSCEFPCTQRFDLRQTPAGDWVSPISHIDPDEAWNDPEEAYDGISGTLAWCPTEAGEWSSYLILLINQVKIDKVRFKIEILGVDTPDIDVDVWYDEAWQDVFEGAVTKYIWVEKDIPAGAQLISKARIRIYNSNTEIWNVAIYEFEFNTAEATAQECIYFDTYAQIPFLPEAPYPVPSGATFQLRVYNDDDAAHKMSVSLAGFLQAKV